jgi:hypothetical protein
VHARAVATLLFAVRLWREQVSDGPEYRGSARDVVSGAFCGFRSWPELVAFMVGRLDDVDPEGAEDAGAAE